MARTRAATRDGSKDSAVAAETAKAQPVPPRESAGPAVAPAAEADIKTRPDTAAPPAEAAAPVTPEEMTGPQDVVVHVEVIWGGITNVRVPVAVAPRYQGLPLAGPAKAFDRLLDSWLTRALDLGMIGSGLGQLFPVNLQRRHEAGTINVEQLLMVGMGEPGQFAQDDLRFLMSNVIVAVKAMGQYQLSTHLIGTRRNELPIEHAVRGFLEGILDGYDRFRAMAEAVTSRRDHFEESAAHDLFVAIAEPIEEKAKRILDAFTAVAGDGLLSRLHLEVARGDNVAPDPVPDPNAVDVEPDVPVTLIRVTRPEAVAPAPPPTDPLPLGTSVTEIFRYSAMSDAAAVTVREVEVNSYVVRELPDRMTGAADAHEHESFGAFFHNYLIPDDFRRLTESAANLTFIVDETTAAFPWEMAAYRKYSHTKFLGTTVGVSRRFHSLLSPPPSSPPALNGDLQILIIANPAPGDLRLRGAHEEGLAVLDVLDQARKRWQGVYRFKVHVRVGSHKENDLWQPLYDKLRQLGDWVQSAEPCDPLKLLLLIVNEHFDVIHYAGHGAFDQRAKRAGWVFDHDCFLSAQEIFRVRQVPRLVFANACLSAKMVNHNEQRGQMVGLAQAFFARGIPNYIGTGWEVDDACARECARVFYSQVLGLRGPQSPPATIGDALLEARRSTRAFKDASSTWGAYQHYGRISDKLLPLPNVPTTSGA
jgi:hypothetical protein